MRSLPQRLFFSSFLALLTGLPVFLLIALLFDVGREQIDMVIFASWAIGFVFALILLPKDLSRRRDQSQL